MTLKATYSTAHIHIQIYVRRFSFCRGIHFINILTVARTNEHMRLAKYVCMWENSCITLWNILLGMQKRKVFPVPSSFPLFLFFYFFFASFAVWFLYFIFMIIKCKWNVAFKQVQNTWLFSHSVTYTATHVRMDIHMCIQTYTGYYTYLKYKLIGMYACKIIKFTYL